MKQIVLIGFATLFMALMSTAPAWSQQCNVQERNFIKKHVAGSYELAGVDKETAYAGVAFISADCPAVMERCIDGQHERTAVTIHRNSVFNKANVLGIKVMVGDVKKQEITYRQLTDLQGKPMLIGSMANGHESLVNKPVSRTQCGDSSR